MTTATEVLARVDAERWCLEFDGSATDVANAIASWVQAGLTVRRLRGRKMHDYQGLFDEFAAALQFPWYFGENANALRECITDLSWLASGRGYVLVIEQVSEVLGDSDDEGLSWLVGLLADTAKQWSVPVRSGEPWDRDATPFHVVVQSDISGELSLREVWPVGDSALSGPR